MKVNFTDVKPSKGFTPLVGWFEMEVESGEARISQSEKNAGTTYINWKLKVVEGDREGAPAWYSTSFSEGGLPMLMAFLQAVGIETNGETEFRIDENDEGDGPIVVGSRLRVRCNEKDGKTNVVGVEPLKQGAGSLLP